MIISPEEKALLDTIVEKQEGGWKLEPEDKNDLDGGWTYAGVTRNTLEHYLYSKTPESKLDWTLDVIQEYLKPPDEDKARRLIYELYKNRFIDKLSLFQLPAAIRGPLLSAAINIGVEEAVKLLQRSLNTGFNVDHRIKVDGNLGPVTVKAMVGWMQFVDLPEFLSEWMRFYINLVQENGRAWRLCAISHARVQTGQDLDKPITPLPKTLRSEYLEGWFNRIEFWRS